MLERVGVTVVGESENDEVVCHWAGGRQSRHALVRSVRGTVQLARHAELLARIRGLHAQGLRPPAIARSLQAEGWRSAHGKGFTEGSVRALLTRMGVAAERPQAAQRRRGAAAGEFTVAEIAARLDLPEGTVYNWLYKGRLPARRVMAAWHTLWLVRLEDVEALLRQRAGAARLPPRPAASRRPSPTIGRTTPTRTCSTEVS